MTNELIKVTTNGERDTMQVIGQLDFYGIVLDIYGSIVEPWFKADDVAKCIEHSNTSKMMNMVNKEEKKVVNLTLTNGYSQVSHGGARLTTEYNMISEFGLYGLLFKSRLPKAEEFNNKVMLTLKQIRLTGGYIPVNEQDTEETIQQRANEIVKETVKHYEDIISTKNKRIEYLETDVKDCENLIETLTNDIKHLWKDTDYGVLSVSEAYKTVTGTINGQRKFVSWFFEVNDKDNEETGVELIEWYTDDNGSRIKNAIDLSNINVYHKFKDLCFKFQEEYLKFNCR